MATEHGTHIPAGGNRKALITSGLLTGTYFGIA